MTRIPALLLIATLTATACDADAVCIGEPTVNADLSAEVDRLQTENDALRAAARLSVAAPVDLPAQDGVAFREGGKPWQKVIKAPETQATIVAIMTACKVKSITISTSGWDPDVSTSDDQVLSLAYSYMGNINDRKCLDAEMVKRKAVDL
jgi:hypothetical protein